MLDLVLAGCKLMVLKHLVRNRLVTYMGMVADAKDFDTVVDLVSDIPELSTDDKITIISDLDKFVNDPILTRV